MSVAARVARICLTAALIASAATSIAGFSGASLAMAAQAGSQPGSTQSSTSSQARLSQRALIVRLAESHVGAQYRFGAEGEQNDKYFDCSGLVYAVFKDAGLVDRISGVRRGAKGYLYWFRKRGLASKTNPKPGDLVIWNNGHHIGIYVGNGMAVSALNRRYGVREHPIGFVHTFTTYLHVQISSRMPAPANGGGTSGGSGGGNSGGTTGGGDGGSSTLPAKVRADVDHLPVHDGPGKSFDRVAIVDRGGSIKVTDSTRDKGGRKWFKVKLANGQVGWVASWHVRVVD